MIFSSTASSYLSIMSLVFLVLFVCACSQVIAQPTPLLIGADIFTPPFTFCNKPDIVNSSIRITQCDPYRSIACNTTNYRCSLNPNFFNDTTNANGTFVAQMIKFTIKTFAELMPGTADGKVQVNVQYNFPNVFYLNGFLQLWRFVSGTAYNYTIRQYELRTVDAPTNLDQTYLYHGLTAGKYVFAFWDNGGTKLGNALPEFSEAFVIPRIFSVKVPLSVQFIPMSTNSSIKNYDTNYKRGNKNYISYELLGPMGYQTLFNLATGSGYNRKIFWEYRTEQGNLINAKTEPETIPPAVLADGFVESMFKFKIFPAMCCSRRTSISARLVYDGLFPSNYRDYFAQRQRYGYGTVLGRRVIEHKKTYFEDTRPIGQRTPFHYQRWVQQTFGSGGTAHPTKIDPGVYVCIKDTPPLNTLTSSGNVDTYHVTTLRRNYCECLNRWNFPGFETPALCSYARDQLNIGKEQEAFKTPAGSNTNNFDQYEDYLALNDYPNIKTSKELGGQSGRPFLLDVDFYDTDNTNGFDYSCNPFTTFYTNIPDSSGFTFYHGDGKTVFSLLEFTQEDVRRVYDYTAPAECNIDGSYPAVPSWETLPVGINAAGISPNNLDPLYNYLGSNDFFNSPCTCLKENAYMNFKNQGSLTHSFYQYEYNNMNAAYLSSTVSRGGFTFGEIYLLLSIAYCANLGPNKLFTLSLGAPVWGGDFLKPFYEYDWRSNLRPNQVKLYEPSGVPPSLNTIILPPTPDPDITVYMSGPSNKFNYCKLLRDEYDGLGYDISCIAGNADLIGTVSATYDNFFSTWVLGTPAMYLFNTGVSSATPFPFTQTTPFTFVYDKTAPPLTDEVPKNQGVYGDPSIVFGTTGLDTFIATADFEMSASFPSIVEYAGTVISIRTSFPTYARFKVVPEIEFYSFLNANAGVAGVSTPTIDILFRVSCPVIDMDDTNNNVPGYVGFCAQNWIITNQYNQPIVIMVLLGPTDVSEPQIPPSFPNYTQQVLLGDVYDSAVFQIRLDYNDGDVLSWYFFPKTEPEKPKGLYYCGAFPSDSGLLKAALSVPVPTQSLVMQPMIVSTKSIPPACEYNQPEMLVSVFRGQFYAYDVVAYQNLPSYDLTGTPLDYGRGTNYWFDMNVNGSSIRGMAVYFQPYAENTLVSVYDQVSRVLNVPVPPPIVIANYTNPMARATYCLNDTSEGICYAPDDDTEDTTFSGIDQWHYYAAGQNQLYISPRFVFNPGFSMDNIGAYFCNMTTQFIDVAIWEIQTKPLFVVQPQCIIPETAYYTYTIKYGKSIAGLTNGQNYPCLERFITYAIILTSFSATPGPLTRISNCTSIDNCCFSIDFDVVGNTGVTEELINMANCTRQECQYEIVTSPAPNNTWGGLCLGVEYTFTIQSPAAMVANRVNENHVSFPYPWRGPAVLVIPLPKKGFGFVPIETTNGNCEEEGSFVDIDFTYTDPECANQIYFNNSISTCRFNVLMAIEPINNAVQYTQTQARLNNPLWLNGTNTPVYNLLNSIKFPEILDDPDFLSIPDGSYRLYLWLSPPGPFRSFSQTLQTNASQTVIADFAAFFSEVNGLGIIRTGLSYPRCPATAESIAKVVSPVQYPTIFIVLTIDIIDQAFNGPYNLTFLSPSGAVVTQVLLEGIVVCNEPCAGYFPTQNNQSCAACDEFMRSKGFSYKLYVGTGLNSAGETGLYFVRVQAVETACVATYPEYITAMNTLSVYLNCHGPQCAGRQDGIARATAYGGTQYPFLLSDFTQNSDRTIAVVRYQYNWTVYTLNGTFVNKYYNNLYIPFASSGIYDILLSDYNDCRVNATCVVQPTYETLEIALVGSYSPNCTGQQGAITVAIVNKTGYPPPPYYLYKIGVDAHPIMTTQGYLLSDNSVKPGDQFFYAVCASIGCCSQILNLSLTAPAGFSVRIAVVEMPCSTTSATGVLEAVVVDSEGNPYVGGVSYAWFFNGIPLGVTTKTLSGAAQGVYRVDAVSVTGCADSDQISLFAAPTISITYERTPVDVNPGRIAGSIFGGNGQPYVVEIFPNIPPDDLASVVIVSVTNSAILTQFVLSNVPSQATLIMRVSDVDGCQNQFVIEGGKIPDTDPIVSPSASPVPIKKAGEDKHDLTAVLMVAMLLIIMGLSLIISYARHVRIHKYTQ